MKSCRYSPNQSVKLVGLSVGLLRLIQSYFTAIPSILNPDALMCDAGLHKTFTAASSSISLYLVMRSGDLINNQVGAYRKYESAHVGAPWRSSAVSLSFPLSDHRTKVGDADAFPRPTGNRPEVVLANSAINGECCGVFLEKYGTRCVDRFTIRFCRTAGGGRPYVA